MFRGFFQLGGTEIINSARTEAYVAHELAGFGLKGCSACVDINQALGVPKYESPVVDDAPWVDPQSAATQGFYGFYPLELTGSLDDTTTSGVTESILDGGFINSPRAGTREMRYRGIMIARDRLALHAGMTWLKAALHPAPCDIHGGSCTGAVACMYAACPEFDLCYEDLASAAVSVPTGSVSVTTPYDFMTSSTALVQGQFRIPVTDGFITRWSGDRFNDYGPIVSRRTNVVTNPSFTTDVAGWTGVGRGLLRIDQGGVDNGPFLRTGSLPPVFSSGFETPSGTTTIAQNVDTNPSFETSAATAELRRNLVQNPGNTIVNSFLTATRSTSVAAGGYTRFTITDALAADMAQRGSTAVYTGASAIPVEAGASYFVSAEVRSSTAATFMRGYVQFADAAGVLLGGSYPLSTVAVNAAVFNTVAGVIVAPATATRAMISIGYSGVTARAIGETFDIRNLFMEKSTVATTFFDGTTQPRLRTNLALKPYGTWPSNNAALLPVVADTAFVRRPGTTSARSGPTATMIDILGGGVISIYNMGGTGASINVNPSVVPGATYTASVWYAANFANPRVQMNYQWFDAASVAVGSQVNQTITGTTTPANTWARHTLTLPPAPAGAAYVRFSMLVTRGATELTTATDLAWLQDALVEQAPVAREYFDGNMAAVANIAQAWAGTALASLSYTYDTDFTPAWSGTANASASIMRGAAPTGVIMGNGVVIQSSAWATQPGKKSARLTNVANASSTLIVGTLGAGYAAVLIPGWTYTILATRWLAAPLTGTLSSTYAGRAALVAITPSVPGGITTSSPTILPNAAGAASLRWTFTVPADATAVTLRLGHGGGAGSGDVWWDDVAVVPGTYTGPYFDGAYPHPNPDFTTAWAGTPNASISVATAPAIAGVATNPANMISYQTTSSIGTVGTKSLIGVRTGPGVAWLGVKTPGAQAAPVQQSVTFKLRSTADTVAAISFRPIVTTAANEVILAAEESLQAGVTRTLSYTFVSSATAHTDPGLAVTIADGAIGDGIIIDDVVFDILNAPGTVKTATLDSAFGLLEASFAIRAVTSTTVTVEIRAAADGTLLGSRAVETTPDWQRFTVLANNGRAVYVSFTATQNFDLDQVMVESGHNGLPYFDGSTTPFEPFPESVHSGTYAMAWTEKVDGSESTMTWVMPGATSTPTTEQILELNEGCEPGWTATLLPLAGSISSGWFEYTVREPISAQVQAEPYERYFHDVVVTAGPTIVTEYAFSTGMAVEVEFTMVAGTPFAYGNTDELLEAIPMSTVPTFPINDTEACPVEDTAPVLDPDCPPLPKPPRPPAVPNVCVDPITTWQRYSYVIDADEVSGWSQMLPTVLLASGAAALRQVRVRFTPNPFEFPIASETRINRVTNPNVKTAADWKSIGGIEDETDNVGYGINLPDELKMLMRVKNKLEYAAPNTWGVLNGAAGHNLVTAGTVVDAGMYVATYGPTLRGRMRVTFRDAANAAVSTVYGTPKYIPARDSKGRDVWTRFTLPKLTVPAGAVRAELVVTNYDELPKGWFSIDATGASIEVRQSTDTSSAAKSYFDGNTKDGAGRVYSWLGTPGLSQSSAVYSAIDPCGWCSEFILSYLPANSELTVDGLTRSAYTTLTNGAIKQASHLLYATNGAPMSWPSLSCGIQYVMSVDVPQGTQPNLKVSLALTRQES